VTHPQSIPGYGDRAFGISSHQVGEYVALDARPRFARIAAFDRILQLSQAPTQLPQPRCDHALRAAPNALVRAAVAKAQAKNSDSNSDKQNSNDCLR
jgi:hypothetical protein